MITDFKKEGELMKVESLKLVCFSPTGTTKSVVKGIAKGINLNSVELIDITKPEARGKTLQTSEKELLIVAVPVYMGRVPALLMEWLQSINASNTPTVVVVVYGNRAYENALLELKDILMKCGCKLIAGAAYIGEHSFSSSELPAASIGRPDISDLKHAELFGNKINTKLLSVSPTVQRSKVNIPGSYPYEGVTELWNVDFISVSNDCIQCGICVEGCPVGAIDAENSSLIDIKKCTLCCACIKNCPQQARSMKPGLMKDAAIRVNKLFQERKEPEIFI